MRGAVALAQLRQKGARRSRSAGLPARQGAVGLESRETDDGLFIELEEGRRWEMRDGWLEVVGAGVSERSESPLYNGSRKYCYQCCLNTKGLSLTKALGLMENNFFFFFFLNICTYGDFISQNTLTRKQVARTKILVLNF